MNQPETFSDLNVDPIEGSQIMRLAGIGPADLMNPTTHSKVRDIMGFFQHKEDKEFIISKLLTGKPGINAIDHLWGYATLRTKYEKSISEVNLLKEQLAHYE